MTGHVTGLECVRCGRGYAEGEVATTCPACGIEGILDVQYDYEALARELTPASLAGSADRSMWRYRPALPVDPQGPRPTLAAGGTPLYEKPLLAQELGLRRLWIKDDGLEPTGSLKDRASAVAVSRAQAEGVRTVTAASTGNAASSLAGFAAAAGLECVIFVPRRAPRSKLAQLLLFGAKVFSVEGTYDQAFDLAQQAADRWGWYNRSCAINPYLVEGKKTVAFEIAEELGWSVPDLVVTSVGDGCILSSLHKGFGDLHRLGLISRIPRLVAVQAEGCQPLKRLFETGRFEPEEPRTLADSIAVGVPRNRLKAVRALERTEGMAVGVPDEAIQGAMRRLGRVGIFAEPAGATALAGLTRLAQEGRLPADATATVLVTGNGLKDVTAAIEAAGEPYRVGCDLPSLLEAAEQAGLAPPHGTTKGRG